uniref:Nonsense-mediated mRNA decay factor SMG8 n=1 Tax=Phallusia mammillata TaxID=59560 RepID=A0A6F9D7R9_9ASCI|nr:protein smg8-like [Phallusia mammillata]
MEEHWKLPYTKELEDAISANEVCVVGVFGKSTWGHTSKGCVINNLTNSASFNPHYPDYLRKNGVYHTPNVETLIPNIECSFDQQKKVLFLHLTTTYDTAELVRACAMMRNHLDNHSDFHDFWKNQEVEIAFSLLYLFSVCHVLILVHPVSIFDISYDKLFHHMTNLRTKVLPHIKDVLKGCSVGRDWWVNGRPCPPRLLFVMQRCHLSNLQVESSGAEHSTKKKKPPLKRLQHTIEDQIYKILRNSRVLTNSAVNCLFTVPPNQAFVHIMTEQFEKVKTEEDPIRSMLKLLRSSCETHRDPTARSRAYRLLTNPPTQWRDEEEDEIEDASNPLWAFLSQHTDLLLSKKGFKDSVGRNALPTHFEVPSLKQWLKVANNLYDLFFMKVKKVETVDETKPDINEKILEMRQELHAQIDPESRFSEARCSKLVSLASAAYQSNLPMHYTSKVHNNQLGQALSTYALHARGPARDKYEACVQAECEAFWNDGRRLCEVHSLTGRHCVHRFHDLPTDGKSQPDANPPKMAHSSRSRTIAASSCGRIQGPRDDPFTLQEANYDFYLRMDVQALPVISDADTFKFPVHERNDKQSMVSPELHCLVEQLHLGSDSSSSEKDVAARIRHRTVSGESDCQTSTQESDSEEQLDEAKPLPADDRQRTTSANYEFSLNSETMPEVQSMDYADDMPQKLTYTEGMMHSGLAEDILPLFSSWSLVRLGAFSSYIPAHGLEMPGFLPGTSFLVPWDISLQGEDTGATHWPVPGEARKLSLKETKLMQQDMTKAYVGYEYETPRGQRFICSAPDKAVKTSGNGIVRDPIQPLLDMDMPLYCTSPVSARSGKPLLGQLMRVYVATPPESNAHITLKPKVVPGPSPTPTFYPSQNEIVLRPNSLWVLRFPYVYVSDSGPHLQPKDLSQLSAWRVLKMISVDIDH